MTIQLTVEEMDMLVAKLNLSFTKRAIAFMGEVPMDNRYPDRMTDAGHRQQVVKQLFDKVEKDHPIPNWRELI